MTAINNLPENFEVEGDVTNLYIGDFNGDGLDDFLRQEKGQRDNDNNNTANIFVSNSDGTFTKFDLPENFEVEGDLTNISVGDFDGDGLDDFLRQEKGSRDNDNNNTTNIFFSNGNGTFSQFDLPENLDIKGDLTNLYTGDFNGDGLDDFLRQEKGSFDDDNANTANIFSSNGDGTFSQFDLPENFDIKGDLTNLYTGDFNGDGLDDFLRQGKNDSGISDSIFFSDGNGGFSETSLSNSIFPNQSAINEITTINDIGDFNGDGKDDILLQRTVASFGSTTKAAKILFSDGLGGFSETTLFSTGFLGTFNFEGFDLDPNTTNLHTGDFDGDGFNDLLRQEKGSADNDNRDTAQIFSNIGFTINGSSGDDSLDGGGGNDLLQGNNGNDTLKGNAEFGATDKSEFSFDQTNGALSFASQQIATLANFDQLQGFDVNRDIQFV